MFYTGQVVETHSRHFPETLGKIIEVMAFGWYKVRTMLGEVLLFREEELEEVN